MLCSINPNTYSTLARVFDFSALAGVISPARAENLKWIKLLEDDEHKNIVIGSLQFLSDNKRVKWHQWWYLCNKSKSRKALRKIAGEITPAMAEMNKVL